AAWYMHGVPLRVSTLLDAARNSLPSFGAVSIGCHFSLLIRSLQSLRFGQVLGCSALALIRWEIRVERLRLRCLAVVGGGGGHGAALKAKPHWSAIACATPA